VLVCDGFVLRLRLAPWLTLVTQRFVYNGICIGYSRRLD
jgi:hypothetical protein